MSGVTVKDCRFDDYWQVPMACQPTAAGMKFQNLLVPKVMGETVLAKVKAMVADGKSSTDISQALYLDGHLPIPVDGLQ